MIIVHAIEDGNPEIYLNPDKIVCALPSGVPGRVHIVSQSQTKEGSIVIPVAETQHQVAVLCWAWQLATPNAVACRLREDGFVEYLDIEGNLIDITA